MRTHSNMMQPTQMSSKPRRLIAIGTDRNRLPRGNDASVSDFVLPTLVLARPTPSTHAPAASKLLRAKNWLFRLAQ
jgi:hypothetical protein